jgi:hypothetical protein
MGGTVVSRAKVCSSTILNQRVVESVMVRHMKSILEPYLPVRVKGPIRSTHNAFQGVVMTSFGGNVHTFGCVSY